MHQQGDEANIPPARIPRGMFFVDPAYSSLQEKRRIGTVSEECAIAVQYYEEETHSTGHVDKETHGIVQAGWKYHWMATFWCGQVNA